MKLSPTERLEWLREQPELVRARDVVSKLLEQYERFLDVTNVGEELTTRFLDKTMSREYMNDAYKFGDLMFEALNSIGGSNQLHRVLLV
jgi:hypothetical protein